ncbi:hypothetical protein Zmor_022736 [Zophobas morio]|uniref:Uncharacterized protein n=1 Tax=Zophobas morio TaxID=2755281 RepID=A0AA38HWN8_9CUCU|nr:hypothetical protein Zmor_022736 [Zophobas morio]
MHFCASRDVSVFAKSPLRGGHFGPADVPHFPKNKKHNLNAHMKSGLFAGAAIFTLRRLLGARGRGGAAHCTSGGFFAAVRFATLRPADWMKCHSGRRLLLDLGLLTRRRMFCDCDDDKDGRGLGLVGFLGIR